MQQSWTDYLRVQLDLLILRSEISTSTTCPRKNIKLEAAKLSAEHPKLYIRYTQGMGFTVTELPTCEDNEELMNNNNQSSQSNSTQSRADNINDRDSPRDRRQPNEQAVREVGAILRLLGDALNLSANLARESQNDRSGGQNRGNDQNQ